MSPRRHHVPDEASVYRRAETGLSVGGRLLSERLAGSSDGLVAVLDLDRFGRINEQHGVDIGDALLAHIERSLQGAVEGWGDALALGGDQFLAVFPGHPSPAEAAPILLAAVRRTAAHTRFRRRVRVTATAGLARWPEHGRTGGILVAAADRALRQAKAAVERNGWAEFRTELEEH